MFQYVVRMYPFSLMRWHAWAKSDGNMSKDSRQGWPCFPRQRKLPGDMYHHAADSTGIMKKMDGKQEPVWVIS